MSDLARLVRETEALRRAGASFMLATVVDVRGSSYRRPGARMLVADDRWIAGCVSGGCLEADVVRRGPHRIREGAPLVVTYDSTSDGETGWGFGLGCNGVVDVLLERVEPDAALDPLRFAGECIEASRRGALVTVIRTTASGLHVGDRVALREGSVAESTLPPGGARDALEALARTALARPVDGRPVATVWNGSDMSALVEVLEPPPRLLIGGAGHDAVPLAILARSMGWRVSIAVAHPSVATRERFVRLAEVVRLDADLVAALPKHARTFAVLMSHDYEADKRALAVLAHARVEYMGILGPARRAQRIVAELAQAGVFVSTAARARLHAPIGLDLGSETPEEIALSIMAEMQAVLTGAPGTPLRDRRAPIHEARVAEARHLLDASAEAE